MNIAAIIANRACGRGVHPIHIHESGRPRLELYIMPPELTMTADLAAQRMTMDFHGGRLFMSKHPFRTAKPSTKNTH